MSGYLLHVGATVLCAHGGQAQPTVPCPRVKVSGQQAVTQPNPYVIAGCGLTGTAPQCVTAQWVTGATRVMAGGQPVLLQDNQSICTPTGTPLNIIQTQVRVKGT